jgi:hypothetical protein
VYTPQQYREMFAQAKPFDAYVASAKPHEVGGWRAFTDRVALSDAQRALIRGFQRRINVLCISGSWCGDCVQQCPLLFRIAEAFPAPSAAPDATNPDTPGIDLRFIERDEHPRWVEPFKICSGARVPVALFLNEDFDFVSMAGDRPLARYRALAAKQLGPSCPLPGAPVPEDEVRATLADWLNEFERVALLLRLSGKLRSKHGD